MAERPAQRPRVAVVVFPGTNCEADVAWALGIAGAEAETVFHSHDSLDGFDAVVLPGGFAHGDYLRPGAIAGFSPVMDAVREMADAGGPVLGICNGFQVLCEAGLLPGALQKNAGLEFLCRPVDLRVETSRSALTLCCTEGQVLREVPINHFEGNFTADPDVLAEIESRRQVVLRYCAPDGATEAGSNPNGSAGSIAGICSPDGNVVGLMPHPERAAEALLGSADGLPLLESFVEAAARWREGRDDRTLDAMSGASA